MRHLAVVAALVGALPALADEGMWTYNNFPSAAVKSKYGFEPTPQWLDKVRLSSARLAGGCSASFVSANGLVMTNHHCTRGCIEQLSTAQKDYIANGFYAKTLADEIQCPAMEINQLAEITDVTDRLNTATQGRTGKEYSDTLKAEMSKIEKECATSDQVRCDVVTLYQGGKYNLYKYRRFQDVRLVFAPEHAIAFFGGDPDNFEFPRYDLDVSFVRVYQDGKSAPQNHYFKWSKSGVKEGDLTFISGHPGRTSRGLTIAELEYHRDVVLPKTLMFMSEMRGMITEFQKRGPEQKRISNNMLFGVENGVKAQKGRHEALLDKAFFAQKVAAEQELRQKVNASPELKQKYGAAWDEIAKAQEQLKNIRKDYTFIEKNAGFSSQMYSLAMALVRGAEELPKENGQRLREFADSNLPALKAQLFSPAPIYPELEIARLEFSLTKLREELGSDHPFVKKVLGKESPLTLATRVVNGSQLRDVKVRQQLFEGGKKAITESKDPMIALARLVEPDARAIRKNYDENIDSVIRKNSELVAKAKFDVYGTNVYPDATFSLRLSYGSVKGYTEDGKKVAPVTVMGGTFDRHTGEDPFALPKTWLDAKNKIKANTPMNFASTNDIIGGNSGSPVINKDAEIVGLVFDGNIQSLGGEFGFDESVNRAVSVHSEAISESLKTVYGATRLLEELRPTKAPTVKSPPAG
ncbi:dipeptidyl-peptidase 7. Serine peptidase. MEROPS family S46 [Stigmatella aurantiaca]|uniref:Dipeptidyl-peptidase n=1 Tax=Stigmatella aurantiaca TaxID=41 RepID=A0A1H7JSF6_STIAU|nr:S46 family peptidase [Stigmatella aurantiaca]SEK77462.1 dipeptidyl-peptidase 7. Serine peptidase. MEROPS family S46 [Stigmatella aurantiaca]